MNSMVFSRSILSSTPYPNSLYAPAALKLYGAPKAVPLMQFTHLAKPSLTFKPGNIGNTPALGISKGNLGAQAHMPVPSKIVTLPAKGMTATNNNGNPGKVTTLPGKINTRPVNAGRVTTAPGKINSHPIRVTNRPVTTAPRRFSGGFGGGGSGHRFAASPSRGSFGGGRSFGGGGFRRR